MKDRIKNMIEKENLSQAEFSRITGINTSTLSHVLTGRNNPSFEVINKILTAFPQYSSAWLVNGEGEPIKDVHSIQEGKYQSTVPYHPNSSTNHPYALDEQSAIPQGVKPPHSLFEDEEFEDKISPTNQSTHQATDQPHRRAPRPPYSSQVASDPYIPYGFPEKLQQKANIPQEPPKKAKVTKIIVYYDDNTFESFIPEKES